MAVKKSSIARQLENFSKILLYVRILRYLLFFYAFIAFIFWFLNCFEVDWIYMFEPLFLIPYGIVHQFYSPQGVSADYSLAIIGGISLLLGFSCDFVINFLYEKLDDLEEEQERQIHLRRTRERRKQLSSSPSAQDDSSITETPENSKLLFSIMPHVKKIKRKREDMELTFQEVEIWKQRVNKKFLENVIYSKPMQKGYYRKNLFLMYKDFNYVDDFIYYTRPTLDTIMLEFRKYGISVSFCYVLSALAILANLEKELDCMDTILSLNFLNEIIVTNRFKITYDNKGSQQYAMQLRGEYNLSKNLSISNKQPLYVLTDKKKAGEAV